MRTVEVHGLGGGGARPAALLALTRAAEAQVEGLVRATPVDRQVSGLVLVPHTATQLTLL